MPDRLQQEIDELLAKLDAVAPKRSLAERMRRAIGGVVGRIGTIFAGVRLPRLSAGHVLLIAIAVIVIAYAAGPSGSGIVRWIIAAGIVAFIIAFVMSLGRHARPPEKYWRDKPMNLRAPGPGSKLRSWWERRRNRR